jgi:hypothetical protein
MKVRLTVPLYQFAGHLVYVAKHSLYPELDEVSWLLDHFKFDDQRLRFE